MVTAIEQHVDWITDCTEFMKRNGHATIKATSAAEDAWVLHVNEIEDETLYPN